MNSLPEVAAIAPPKLATKRLLRIVEWPPFACKARVPWTSRTVQLFITSSPLSTSTAAVPLEDALP